MNTPYQTIHSFFDCYGLVHARSILQELIKKADSEKSWNRSACCDVLFYTEKITELIEAGYEIADTVDYNSEVILNKDNGKGIWHLTEYDKYCGTHRNGTPFDFFPRFLSKKEFLDPYKALEKFSCFRNMDEWKQTIKDLAVHALSNTPLNEFDDDKSILQTYIHLNKLIEATHLIQIRMHPATPKLHNKQKSNKIKNTKSHQAQSM